MLAQRGITTYLPRFVHWPRPPVGSAIMPLFPGYLFVRLAHEQCARVGWTPGVKAFVSFGGTPAALDAQVIDFLRQREGADGLIVCGEPSGAARAVRIVHGPFRGLHAVVERRLPALERVRVLMQLLERDTPVELPAAWVREA